MHSMGDTFMTNQTNWTELERTDKELVLLAQAADKNGFILRHNMGYETNIIKWIHSGIEDLMKGCSHFWIIPDDPLREMKIRQAMTGQPVWVKVPHRRRSAVQRRHGPAH